MIVSANQMASSPEQQLLALNAALNVLSLMPADLAKFMDMNRGYRDFSATIRGIQRR
jgi:hypothetical protein